MKSMIERCRLVISVGMVKLCWFLVFGFWFLVFGFWFLVLSVDQVPVCRVLIRCWCRRPHAGVTARRYDLYRAGLADSCAPG
jgi:hypothetical protein